MADLTLYSARACPFAHRTRLVLNHKALDFDLVEVDLQNKPSWFQTVSGYGKVPALEHGDLRIWESAIINEYLDEAFAERPLLSREPGTRAIARIWIDFANTRLAPAFSRLLRGATEGEQAQGRRELTAALEYLEHGLHTESSGGPFFLGSAPSLVDFALYPWFERLPALAHLRGFELAASHGRLHRWRSATSALDAVVAQASPTEFYIERYAATITVSRKVA
jgi:glutathione S-transferase